ncbi:MAG: hypothetical protein AAF708_12780 [Deinococcota bacterium]
MEITTVLTLDEILKGLKHYKRIAKQDLLRATETANPELFRSHAEARRSIYAELTATAEEGIAREVVGKALETYRKLPFVTGTPDDAYVDIKGQENALENFFLMVGLDPKTRREVRSQRPSLATLQASA